MWKVPCSNPRILGNNSFSCYQAWQYVEEAPASVPVLVDLNQWCPPFDNSLKINFDEATFMVSQRVRFGVILCNGGEEFIFVKACLGPLSSALVQHYVFPLRRSTFR